MTIVRVCAVLSTLLALATPVLAGYVCKGMLTLYVQLYNSDDDAFYVGRYHHHMDFVDVDGKCHFVFTGCIKINKEFTQANAQIVCTTNNFHRESYSFSYDMCKLAGEKHKICGAKEGELCLEDHTGFDISDYVGNMTDEMSGYYECILTIDHGNGITSKIRDAFKLVIPSDD